MRGISMNPRHTIRRVGMRERTLHLAPADAFHTPYAPSFVPHPLDLPDLALFVWAVRVVFNSEIISLRTHGVERGVEWPTGGYQHFTKRQTKSWLILLRFRT